MEEEDAMRTMECLRGRLLAERAASKAAKENAELLAEKLKELEKQLKIETNYRRKAEKKLCILKKKMHSLNIRFSISEESEHSSSSDYSETSCISTENPNQKSQTSNSDQTEKIKPEIVVDRQSFNPLELKKKSNKDEITENSMALVPISTQIESKNSSNVKMEVNSESVREVLDTLKLIRENLQSTMEKRRMIKVG